MGMLCCLYGLLLLGRSVEADDINHKVGGNCCTCMVGAEVDDARMRDGREASRSQFVYVDLRCIPRAGCCLRNK